MIFSLSNKLSYNQNKIFEDQISNNYKNFRKTSFDRVISDYV